jgi:opacity protein-like surface antigen
MKLVRLTTLATLACGLLARPAFADLTGFIGANATPSNRLVRGVAAGGGLLIIGFEFEYSTTSDDPSTHAPSLTTGMGNVLLQTPTAILGFQPYFTTGGGLYRETLGTNSNTSFGLNTGGGVKVSLAGPLRLRVDYRVFSLGSNALYSPAHRVYVGINLKL